MAIPAPELPMGQLKPNHNCISAQFLPLPMPAPSPPHRAGFPGYPNISPAYKLHLKVPFLGPQAKTSALPLRARLEGADFILKALGGYS